MNSGIDLQLWGDKIQHNTRHISIMLILDASKLVLITWITGEFVDRILKQKQGYGKLLILNEKKNSEEVNFLACFKIAYIFVFHHIGWLPITRQISWKFKFSINI